MAAPKPFPVARVWRDRTPADGTPPDQRALRDWHAPHLLAELCAEADHLAGRFNRTLRPPPIRKDEP